MVTIPTKEIEMDCIERAAIGLQALKPTKELNEDEGYLIVKPGAREIDTISEENAQTYLNAMKGPFDIISINDVGIIYTQSGVIGSGLAFYFYNPFVVGKATEKGLEPLNKIEMKGARAILEEMERDGDIDNRHVFFYKFIDFAEDDDDEEDDLDEIELIYCEFLELLDEKIEESDDPEVFIKARKYVAENHDFWYELIKVIDELYFGGEDE